MDTVATISRAEYRAWAEQQPRGRFERVDGRAVKKRRQTAGHSRMKAAVWRALDDAVRAAGLACQAYGSGITVEVGEHTDYEPDALINGGPAPAADDFAAPNPIVVVEVLAADRWSSEAIAKVVAYFRVPSVQHCLVVHAQRPEVVHYRQGDMSISPGFMQMTMQTKGTITLDPPGISIALDAIYRDVTL